MNIYRNYKMENTLNHLDIIITDNGYVKTDESWGQKNVLSPYSRLYFIEEGEGVLKFSNHSVTMKPGYVYLIPVGIVFDFYSNDYVKKLFFHINIYRENMYDFTAEYKKYGKLYLGEEKIKKLIQLYHSETFSDALRLKTKIFSIVAEITDEMVIMNDEISCYSESIMDTIEYIKKNLSLKLSVKELADRLFISESILAKKFRKEVGITLGKYIDKMVFYEAEKLIMQGDLTIGQISEQLGFCDQFYFSRKFKERYQETPQSYIMKLKNNKYV